jgi:hypothetical protein
VNEGYRNDYAPPIDPNSLAPTRTFFRSTSETLRAVYLNAPATTSSVNAEARKRGRSFSNMPEDDENKGASTGAEEQACPSRPTKPLRRAFDKSKSLPASAFSVAPTGPAEASPATSTITEATMEDDWSDAAFGGGDGEAGAFTPTHL